MALLTRPAFLRGWMPDADAVGAPTDCLLRMDNCILDEVGTVSLRAGSDILYTLADLDVHSLYTAVLSGIRYRLVGAGDSLYVNGSSVASGLAGTGDVTFGSMLGQIFASRSTSRKKYDGTTLRNWGLSMTGGVPTVAGLGSDTIAMATGDSTEAPAFSYVEDDGTGATFTTGYEGTANGAIRLHIKTTTGHGRIRKTYAADQDWSTYGSVSVSDDDYVSVWCWVEDAVKLNGSPFGFIEMTIWVNNSTIGSNDYYDYVWSPNAADPAPGQGSGRTTFVTGWNKLVARRGDFAHGDSGGSKTWTTARAIDLFCGLFVTGTAFEARFDSAQVSNALVATGDVTWRYRYVNNNGTYAALSAPSTASAGSSLVGLTGATVTVPSDTSRDTQTNEIWLYRNSAALGGDYYRTAVKTSVSGTGVVAIDDSLSDADAVATNLVLDDTDTTPPDAIIGIAGPHFDRLWVLTDTTLYLSRSLNPDTFSTDQSITIGGSDEVAYWIVKSSGTLYVGTSKDIYRIEGTAAELPDGTVQIAKRPMNVAHPPISRALATEGTQAAGASVGPAVAYVSSAGWRAFNGYAAPLLVGPTSLLYRGYSRHGVLPVNLSTGRLRAALGQDQLLAITPEGTDADSSAVLYRATLTNPYWYRHTYPVSWRAIAAEPDGTIIAGDTAGHVWTLDSNHEGTDNGTGIDVTVWTKADDADDPFRRKRLTDVHLQVNTGGTTMAAALYQDQAASASVLMSDISTSDAMTHLSRNVLAGGALLTAQLRLTGRVNRFQFGPLGWSMKRMPLGIMAWDSGPIDAGAASVLWVRAVRVHALGTAPLVITIYADGVQQDQQTVTPISASQASPVLAWLSRGVKGGSMRVTIESTAEFVPYWIELIPRATGQIAEQKPLRVNAEVAA